jgi:demethylmenaquinone methyltransferase/2-methoxy-6-polyprenyl-1,4-benzoquinol methylase
MYQSIIDNLLQANPLREPLLRSIVQSLHLPAGSRGLDVGCGIGLQAQILAEAVGEQGHVTGVDIFPELLAFAADLADKAGLSGRITFQEGDMAVLPFPDHTFDWAWSADCIGYPTGEIAPVLKELLRLLRPGGRIYLLAWTSQQVLPGHPILEASLNATCSGYLPHYRGKNPEVYFLRALPCLRQVGLADVKAQTYVGEVQGPLTTGQRTALLSLFQMLWGSRQPEASPGDWQEYQRLCTPGSADLILDLPDYYAFFTYTVSSGKVPIIHPES